MKGGSSIGVTWNGTCMPGRCGEIPAWKGGKPMGNAIISGPRRDGAVVFNSCDEKRNGDDMAEVGIPCGMALSTKLVSA